jgi:hypothetical protein
MEKAGSSLKLSILEYSEIVKNRLTKYLYSGVIRLDKTGRFFSTVVKNLNMNDQNRHLELGNTGWKLTCRKG